MLIGEKLLEYIKLGELHLFFIINNNTTSVFEFYGITYVDGNNNLGEEFLELNCIYISFLLH